MAKPVLSIAALLLLLASAAVASAAEVPTSSPAPASASSDERLQPAPEAPGYDGASPARPATAPLVAAGAVHLGGSAGFQLDSFYDEEWKGAWRLDVAATVGYLVLDRLELAAEVGLRLFDGHYYDLPGTGLLAVVGAKYVFGSGAVLPYVGLLAGVDVWFDEGEEGGESWVFFDAVVPTGVLFPLVRNVALDLGLRPRVMVGVSYVHTVAFDVTAQLGVRVYF